MDRGEATQLGVAQTETGLKLERVSATTHHQPTGVGIASQRTTPPLLWWMEYCKKQTLGPVLKTSVL